MNKNRIGGLRWRASGPMIAKPISIKLTGGKSGGCASKAVELTSGGLRHVTTCEYYSRRAEEGPNGREWRVSRAISGATSGRKANLVGLPDVSRSEAPRDIYEGTESFSGDAQYRKPGYSHLAQPAEPPYADPHVRWGEGRTGDRSPYPDYPDCDRWRNICCLAISHKPASGPQSLPGCP